MSYFNSPKSNLASPLTKNLLKCKSYLVAKFIFHESAKVTKCHKLKKSENQDPFKNWHINFSFYIILDVESIQKKFANGGFFCLKIGCHLDIRIYPSCKHDVIIFLIFANTLPFSHNSNKIGYFFLKIAGNRIHQRVQLGSLLAASGSAAHDAGAGQPAECEFEQPAGGDRIRAGAQRLQRLEKLHARAGGRGRAGRALRQLIVIELNKACLRTETLGFDYTRAHTHSQKIMEHGRRLFFKTEKGQKRSEFMFGC
jgi:hypothetical protein